MSKIPSLRWFGALALAGAVLMLVLGETWLKQRLAPVWMLAFWMVCFLLTVLAMVVALVELRAIRIKARQAQLSLFQETLDQISVEAGQSKPAGPPSSDGKPPGSG